MHPILTLHDTITQIHHPAEQCPGGTCGIEQWVSGVEQIGFDQTVIHPHGILQHCLVKCHLHAVVLLGLHPTPQGIFIGLTRLHLDESLHRALHVVKTSLQSQCFADVGGFEYGFALVQVNARFAEGVAHRLPDVKEVLLTVGKELPLHLRILQV